MIERRPRAPVLRSMALRAIVPRASSAQREIDRFHLEQALILLDQRVLGWVRMSFSDGSSRSSSVATTGSRPTNSGNQAVLQEVLGLGLGRSRRCHDLPGPLPWRRSRSKPTGRAPR